MYSRNSYENVHSSIHDLDNKMLSKDNESEGSAS